MFSVMAAARASVGARTEFGSSSRWIDRWLAACRDLAELERSNPMTDAVVEEIDGRMIRIGDQWLADFASCNYLGFDLDREIVDAVSSVTGNAADRGEVVRRAGAHDAVLDGDAEHGFGDAGERSETNGSRQ